MSAVLQEALADLWKDKPEKPLVSATNGLHVSLSPTVVCIPFSASILHCLYLAYLAGLSWALDAQPRRRRARSRPESNAGA
jgi:hypothetical protein